MRFTLLIALVALAVVPARAAGQTTLRSVPEAARGPSAWDGGDRFVAARWTEARRYELHVLGTRSRAPMAMLPAAPGRGGQESLSLAASPRWVVARRSRHRVDRQGPLEDIAGDVVIADWSGALRTVDSCTTPRKEIRSTPVDIDGDVMAWSDTGCVPRAEVAVFDAATGARSSLPVPDDPAVGAQPMVDSVWVRGRWVAAAVSSWDRRLSGKGAVVYVFDRITGEVRLRAEPGLVRTGTLAGDGTLIACSAAGRLVRFSPAMPAGEELPIPLRCGRGVAERDGQVAFLTPAPPAPGLTYGDDLYAAPLDGSAPPRLLLERPASLVGFDGTRAAVFLYSDCRGRQGFGIAGDPAGPAAPPHTCPLKIGELRVRPGQRPRLRVSCPLGCVFSVSLSVPGRRVATVHRAAAGPDDRFVALPRVSPRTWGRHRRVLVRIDLRTRCCSRTVKRRVRLDVRA